MRMRLPLLLPAALLAVAALAAPAIAAPAAKSPVATIILVRHAEKDTTVKDPAMKGDVPLSAAGRARAAALANVLKESNVWRIYATPYQRTMRTGEPLAQAIGDSVRIVAKTPDLVERLKREAWGHTVLVVGHSNTVPEITGLLTGTKPRPMPDDEYDLMVIVTLDAEGHSETTLLHYGEPRR